MTPRKRKRKQYPCEKCGKPCNGNLCIGCYRDRGSQIEDGTCDYPGCSTTLSRPNKSGRCKLHRYDVDIPGSESFDVLTDRDTASINSVRHDIRTVAEALKYADFDPVLWEVVEQRVKTYQTTLAVKRDNTTTPETVQMWSISVKLRRKIPHRLDDALSMVLDRMKKHAPKNYPKQSVRKRPQTDGYMLEFSPMDHHMGGLAWAPETGEDWDVTIARDVFRQAVDDVLALAQQQDIDGFLVPVGSDFFAVDNLLGQTVNGTPQDTDGRWARVFDAGVGTFVAAIDRMREIAPVRLVWVGGNHDWSTSYYLASVLDAWYRDCGNVVIDRSPAPRKYVEFGTVLLGITHGDEERHDSLPAIMATERPEEWARATHREWHLGHLHKRKQVIHTAVDTHDGVVVRILPSMTGRNAWHQKRGYGIGGPRCAEAYLWSRLTGYVGHFAVGVQPRGRA